MTVIPAGYCALAEKYHDSVITLAQRSYFIDRGEEHYETEGGTLVRYFRKSGRKVPSSDWEQLEFALKYEGFNFSILRAFLAARGKEDVQRHVAEKPKGKWRRMIGFLAEIFCGWDLDLSLPERVSYVDLCEGPALLCGRRKKNRKFKVVNNLLGAQDVYFTVRLTEKIRRHQEAQYDQRANRLLERYSPEILRRANTYLYAKETKSSFAIEREHPDRKREARFIRALKESDSVPTIDEAKFVQLQNIIVEDKYRESSYRTFQNYVGASHLHGEEVHYIPPKSGDLEELMSALVAVYDDLMKSETDPVITAAIVSFYFVYVHPFGDGNGRIHRWLIHHVLSKKGFTPKGFVFPVSAVMLNDMVRYDECLEAFSGPLMERLDYEIDEIGKMTVNGPTIQFYKSIDMTPHVEFLYDCIEASLSNEFEPELGFLEHYDEAIRRIREVVDMPDKKMSFFIRAVIQNEGRLSKAKRDRYFEELSEHEIELIESKVRRAFDFDE